MPRGTEIEAEKIKKFMKETGFARTTAVKHRARQSDEWKAFCSKFGYNPSYNLHRNHEQNIDNDLKELIDETINERMNDNDETMNENATNTEKYKLLEETAFAQLRKCQMLLDNSINEQDFQTLRAYVGAVKDLSSQFNELTRLRQIAEIQEGNFLPMSILERYKTHFYPRLNSGLDEMKIAIENALPPEMVADFQHAWNSAYYRYKDAAREAEKALNEYRDIASREALASLDKKENNKHKAKEATKQKLKK